MDEEMLGVGSVGFYRFEEGVWRYLGSLGFWIDFSTLWMRVGVVSLVGVDACFEFIGSTGRLNLPTRFKTPI